MADYDSAFRRVPLQPAVPEASLNHPSPADPPSGEVGVSGREKIQGALELWGRSSLGLQGRQGLAEVARTRPAAQVCVGAPGE